MKLTTFLTLLAAFLVLPSVSTATDWPQWRGPLHNGSSDEQNLPDSLTGPIFSVDLPGPSGATPAVSGGRVYLSSMDSANTGAFLALCLDAKTGAILWEKPVAADTTAFPRNNMATPSPVTDGQSAAFLFGSGHLVAFDTSGKQLWSRNIQNDYGNLSLKYGYSSSPLLYDDKLYIPIMRRPEVYRDPPSDKPLASCILVIDFHTGKTIGVIDRPTDAIDESFDSYSTPVLFHTPDGDRILTIGGDYIVADNPRTFAELWRYGYNPDRQEKWRNIPSVVTGEGFVFGVTARAGRLVALKPTSSGRLSQNDIAWTFDGPTTDSPTPTYANDRLYVLYGRGRTITCLDAKTGTVKWQGKLPGRTTCYASPTVADGKIYCLSEGGNAVVLSADSDEFAIISQTTFDEGPMQSTIAVADGRIYIRTAKKLHCFANK
jgi:outer membrane protein assembly factor BamB